MYIHFRAQWVLSKEKKKISKAPRLSLVLLKAQYLTLQRSQWPIIAASLSHMDWIGHRHHPQLIHHLLFFKDFGYPKTIPNLLMCRMILAFILHLLARYTCYAALSPSDAQHNLRQPKSAKVPQIFLCLA